MPTAKPARSAKLCSKPRAGCSNRIGLPDFSETSIELIGTESQYGAFSAVTGSREVAMKIAAKHPDMAGIGILLKEAVGLGLATPPGLSGFAGSRPSPSPVVRLFSCTVPKAQVQVRILLDDATVDCDEVHGAVFDSRRHLAPGDAAAQNVKRTMVEVPLIALAWGRSGDKGNKANIGIIARKPRVPALYLRSADRRRWCASALPTFSQTHPRASVERFLLPGANAINFLLHDVLGGGGVASIRNDPQGKGYAQLLLSCPIPVPSTLRRPSRSLCHDGVLTPRSTSTPTTTRKTVGKCWH